MATLRYAAGVETRVSIFLSTKDTKVTKEFFTRILRMQVDSRSGVYFLAEPRR